MLEYRSVKDASTLDHDGSQGQAVSERIAHALCVIWSSDGFGHLGEHLSLPGVGSAWVFGRGRPASDELDRILPMRLRPNSREPGSPFENPYISRRQLALTAHASGIELKNLGRRQLLFADGRKFDDALLSAGDLCELESELLLLCVKHPELPPPRVTLANLPAFGAADRHGLVGESPAAWAMRENVAYLATRRGHALVYGESGTGKELLARALHAESPRHEEPLVDWDADGESSSTLLVHDIGELARETQDRLIRLLDEVSESGGRIIATTRRDPSELAPELAARFKLRIATPGLDERTQDIPLLCRHLLQQAVQGDPQLGARFSSDGGCPRITLPLMKALVAHRYEVHVRELDALLWQALTSSRGDVLELTDDVRRMLKSARQPAAIDVRKLTPESILLCLERHDGVQERAWRELGLSSRYALKRLIKKHGLGSRIRR